MDRSNAFYTNRNYLVLDERNSCFFSYTKWRRPITWIVQMKCDLRKMRVDPHGTPPHQSAKWRSPKPSRPVEMMHQTKGKWMNIRTRTHLSEIEQNCSNSRLLLRRKRGKDVEGRLKSCQRLAIKECWNQRFLVRLDGNILANKATQWAVSEREQGWVYGRIDASFVPKSGGKPCSS